LVSRNKKGHDKRIELYHFFKSWLENIHGKFENPRFILFSNHVAAKNLAACLDTNTFTFSKAFIEGSELNNVHLEKRQKIFDSIKEKCNQPSDDLIKEFLGTFEFKLNQKSMEEYQNELAFRLKKLLGTDSDHDFPVLKKFIVENYYKDTAITRESIEDLIAKIHFEKNLSWFRNYSSLILSQIRDKIGETHIKQDLSLHKLLSGDSPIVVIHGESGSGKTALIKSLFFNFWPLGKCLYFDSKELLLFANAIRLLMQNYDLGKRVSVIVIDNINTEANFEFLSEIIPLHSSIKIIVISETKYLQVIRKWLMNEDCDSYEHHMIFNDQLLQEHFPVILQKVPEDLRLKLTAFTIDKLVQLEEVDKSLLNKSNDLSMELLDLWFSKEFVSKKDEIIVLMTKLAYAIATKGNNSIKAEEKKLLSMLHDNSIIITSSKGNNFAHDNYFRYAIYKYFEKIYQISFCIENNLDFFLEKCINVKDSALFFIRHFHEFLKIYQRHFREHFMNI
jgi:hypothetical protein